MRKLFLAITILLISGVVSVSAQPNPSPLLQMLARVPDTAAAHDLSYVDYTALFAARPGAPTVKSWQDYQNLAGANRDLLMSALLAIHAGPSFYTTYFTQSADMPKVVGFDLFSIERAAQYGQPPYDVTILEGNFDSKAILAAHESRGYIQSNSKDGLTLLCGANGCDSGMKMDLSNRNLANPFGGQFGRSQPVIVADQLVASSASIDALNQVASTITTKTSSLADQADYHAAAEAISANGTALQVMFLDPSVIGTASSAAVEAALLASPTQAAQLSNTLSTEQANFVALPQYDVVALADIAAKDEEQTLVALVYPDPSQAQAAAALFPDRLQNYVSQKANSTFGDLLKGRGVTSIDTSVYSASTNRSVLVLTLHAPLPGATVPTDGSKPVSLGQTFRLLTQAYYNRDLGWLATSF